MTRHPGAWLVWLLGALVVASSSIHPFVSVTTIAASLAVATSLADRSERGPLRVIVMLGVVFIGIRIALFTLTGRAGETTLVTLPGVELPGFLGGFEIGGPISAEVLFTELGDGLRLFAILVATGTLVCVTDPGRLVRLLPSRLRHAGVVVQVALSFVPALAASAREVREAQTVRGLAIPGPRSAAALVVPVLAGAVDRAFGLAETLHARGFERDGWTRYRSDPLTARDRVVVAVSIAAIVVAMLAARTGAGAWAAHPVLSWPAADWRLLIAPLLLLAPLAVTSGRGP